MICIAEVYHSLCRAGTEGVPEAGGAEWGFFLGTVSRRWKFSRRSFYRELCGHAGEAIACYTQLSPPDETPAAPQAPQVSLLPAACSCPELHPTSQTPALGSAPCVLCSAPNQESESRDNIITEEKSWKCDFKTLVCDAHRSLILSPF